MTPLVLVGEALGDSELRVPGHPPLVGPSGVELIRMLGAAGILSLTSFDREYIHRYYTKSDPSCIDAIWNLHPEVFRTNVFMLHPPRNDLEWFCGPKSTAIPGYPALIGSKFVREEFTPELDRLANEIMDHNPNVVVCLGNAALWALVGKTGISKVRGTTLVSTHTALDFKLLPTFHPAAVIRDWTQRPTVVADLMKARREMEFPDVRRPYREIWIEPGLDDIARFFQEYVRTCNLLSVDIETSGSRITCIGFAPTEALGIVIPFDDSRAKSGSYWPSISDERKCWKLIRSVLEDPSIPKLFQNGTYDISFLLRAYGIRTFGAIHDTMLLSHALQPEALKGLGYLGSIHTDEGAWKFMREKYETIKREN